MIVSVIGLGYVGLSLSVLLSQKHEVFAVDIDRQKVELLVDCKSPIADPDISSFLSERDLNLTATLDFDEAVKKSEFVVIATPTDYDVARNSFDTSSVRGVARKVRDVNGQATIIVKSTIPIGSSKTFVVKLVARTFISHRNSCVRVGLFMTTFIRRVLLSGGTVKYAQSSPVCWRNVQPYPTVRASYWERRRQRLSNFLPIHTSP